MWCGFGIVYTEYSETCVIAIISRLEINKTVKECLCSCAMSS
jgi:hypothetical protein